MKRFLTLFVLLALALSVFILAASAQTDLPAIDETAAADYLGRWYMIDVCDNNTCMNFPDLGVIVTYDVNADNTITVNADSEDSSTNRWYMEDGMAYSIVELSKTKNSVSLMNVEDNGMLVIMSDTGYVTFSREQPNTEVSAEPVADAGMNEFAGVWYFKGFMAEGQLIPASLLGTEMTLTIGNETLKLSDGTGENEAAYTLEEGKLHSAIEGTDDQGQPIREDIMAEIHEDGTLFFYFDPGTADETIFVFTDEKNTVGISDLQESLSSGGNAEGGLDLAGLMENLLPGGMENLDLNGLLQKFTGSENIDLNGLIQQVTGGLTSGEGQGFDLSGMLEGLTSGNADGQGGFDLSGLMNLFGSGE